MYSLLPRPGRPSATGAGVADAAPRPGHPQDARAPVAALA
jgi:hypothetical protein